MPAMIRLNIQRKVFLATFALATAMALLLVGLTHWNLERGFARYVAEAELGRLDWLDDYLESAYAERGNWEFLRSNGAWSAVHRSRAGGGPPFAAGEGFRGPPGGGMRRGDGLGIWPRLALLDADGRLVAGNPAAVDAAARRPLSSQGKVIGSLALQAPQTSESALDAAFLVSQTRDLLFSGLAALFLSLLAAWLLARHLLAPIRELAAGARAIAAGRFSHPIGLNRSDELGELAADFNTMAELLARTEKSRRQWLADTSHELRTPIAVLRAEIEAMQDGVRQTDGPTLERLHKQAMQLAKLVDDLRQSLDAMPENIVLDRASVKPVTLLREAVEEFRDRYREAGIAIDSTGIEDGGWTVCGDADRLHQVFANILENSLRYTEAGGHLRLRAAASQGWLRLDFDDTPPAPPDAALPRLCERFFRAEPSRSRAHGGSGLGLAICKALVEAHGGSIAAARSDLGGLSIRLRLPLDK